MTAITKKSVSSPKGEVTLFTVTNASGASVTLTNIGAGIVAVNVPDKNGKLADVAMGYANALDYFYDGACSGKVPGRYAGRIAKGHFCIDGKEYSLAINNGPNALHGGPEGFHNQVWEAREIENGVEFSRTSPDGEENYPGTLVAKAIYTFDDNNVLTLNLQATTDKKTVVNLTNHCYFNLAGHDTGSVLNHLLRLNADKFVPTDDTLIPTGEILDVKDTPMDFMEEHAIIRDFNADFPALKYGKGYDNSWVIRDRKPGKLTEAAVLTDPESGRRLIVSTDQPIVHIYTGNWISGNPVSKSGYEYSDYDTVAIECQDFPDAPNHPNFPSTLLAPGEIFNRTIQYNFTTI